MEHVVRTRHEAALVLLVELQLNGGKTGRVPAPLQRVWFDLPAHVLRHSKCHSVVGGGSQKYLTVVPAHEYEDLARDSVDYKLAVANRGVGRTGGLAPAATLRVYDRSIGPSIALIQTALDQDVVPGLQ